MVFYSHLNERLGVIKVERGGATLRGASWKGRGGYLLCHTIYNGTQHPTRVIRTFTASAVTWFPVPARYYCLLTVRDPRDSAASARSRSWCSCMHPRRAEARSISAAINLNAVHDPNVPSIFRETRYRCSWESARFGETIAHDVSSISLQDLFLKCGKKNAVE